MLRRSIRWSRPLTYEIMSASACFMAGDLTPHGTPLDGRLKEIDSTCLCLLSEFSCDQTDCLGRP